MKMALLLLLLLLLLLIISHTTTGCFDGHVFLGHQAIFYSQVSRALLKIFAVPTRPTRKIAHRFVVQYYSLGNTNRRRR